MQTEPFASKLAHRPGILLLGIAVWLGALAWVRPLAVPDEARYTDIVRWMAIGNDWLVPRLNGAPFLHKPPLYFWLEALTIRVLGVSAPSARLVSWCAAASLCAAVFWFALRHLDARSARWTLLVLALNPLLFVGAQFANLDMLVAAFITLATVLAIEASRTQSAKLWIAAYAACAFGVLSKPAGTFLLWAVMVERAPARIWQALSLRGMLLFAALVVPWFVAVEHSVPGFLRYFLVHQHFERYTQTGFNNAYGIWFYPAVLALGLLP
jgi:4-amino-4-deoxy-L-arabinose transferase-like glycosyltransferase